MLSLEGFVRQCREHIARKEPFIAYWHSHGYGFLRTGEVMSEEYVIQIRGKDDKPKRLRAKNCPERDFAISAARRAGERIDWIKAEQKPRKVAAGTVTKLRKAIARMQKDFRIAGTLRVVECDGESVVADGGIELEASL